MDGSGASGRLRSSLTSRPISAEILAKRDQTVPGPPAPPEAIPTPPIDDLLKAADSKYALVIYSAKRARQINAYYSQLGEGLLEYVGPLVETHVHEKPLSIAMREINGGLLTSEKIDQ